MAETVYFKIDCEWLCNFIRNRVYWEGLEYSTGIELLQKSFELTPDLCDDILRGKKTIRGINEGELIDDTKYQDYLDWVKREEIKKAKLAIQNDILINPLNYVDPFATKYSFWGFEKVQSAKKDINESSCTVQDVLEFFEYHRDFLTGTVNDLSDKFLKGGCYGIENPDYLFDNHIINGPVSSKFEFWDSLFIFFEKLLAEDNWLSKDVKNEIIMRQESHRAWRRAQYYKSDEYVDKLLTDFSERRVKENLAKIESKIEASYIDGSEHLSGIYYVPSDKFTPYGIIAPNGDFYSCDFAAHKPASALIAKQNGLLKEFDAKDSEDELDSWGRAKEALFEAGYTFVNTIGHPGLMNKWYMDYEQMPQKAIDKCFDWELWNREQK